MFTAGTFFHADIQACLDYGLTLLGLACASTLKPLVSLHKRVCKLILLKSASLTGGGYKTLNILSLKLKFELNNGIVMYEIMFDSTMPYLR